MYSIHRRPSRDCCAAAAKEEPRDGEDDARPAGLAARLQSLPGVRGAEVDYETGRATVRIASEGAEETVLEAIFQQGYEGKIQN